MEVGEVEDFRLHHVLVCAGLVLPDVRVEGLELCQLGISSFLVLLKNAHRFWVHGVAIAKATGDLHYLPCVVFILQLLIVLRPILGSTIHWL